MEAKSDIFLILDLDETLVYATEDKLDIQEDFMFDEYYVYKRPGLDNFLIKIKDHYEIGIWSSAGDEYVSEIVKKVSPND